MRHFRMPQNQNLKNLAILQKHIGSILREISKYEEEDRKRALSASCGMFQGSKQIGSPKKRSGVSKLTNKKSTLKRAQSSEATTSRKTNNCKKKQLIYQRSLICTSCNVISRTARSHMKHLDGHEVSPISCLKCKKCFHNYDSFSWHADSCGGDSKKTVYKCTQCQRIFKSKKDISRHLIGHRRNNCPYCGKPITLRKVLIKHLITFHRVQLEKYILNCHLCDRRFLKKQSLYYHLQKHFKDKIVCIQCGYLSMTKDDSEEHLTKHNEQKKFKCPTCNIHFSRQQLYLLHIKGHSIYKCITCNQSYGTREKLLCHKRKGHIVEGLHPRFICPYCPNIFHKKVRLVEHLKKHPDTMASFNCKYCDRSFPSPSLYFKHCLLVSHKKFITELIKFQCDICNKKSSKEYLLDKHRFVVHGIAKEPFSCHSCDFKTYYKNNYERHELLHVTKEKSFACDHCSKLFHTSASLKDHVSYNHLQGKKYACEECKKSFKRLSELTRHKATHSDTRPFVCEVCGTTFKRMAHLRRHEKGVHQITSRVKKRTVQVLSTPSGQDVLEVPTETSHTVENNDEVQCDTNPVYSLQPSLCNTAEDLRLVMQENLVTLENEAFMGDIADPSYDFLVHLTTDEHADIDILDLSSVSEFR